MLAQIQTRQQAKQFGALCANIQASTDKLIYSQHQKKQKENKMRVEQGTRFFDESDERCYFNKLVLERGRYAGRFNENDPAASIAKIMQSGSKFDDTMQEWFRAVERSKSYES